MRIRIPVLLALVASPIVMAQTPSPAIVLTAPNSLGLGQNRVEVTIKGANGEPITNADVALSLVMPADSKTKHPEMRTAGKLNNAGSGKYSGVAMVTMAGS